VPGGDDSAFFSNDQAELFAPRDKLRIHCPWVEHDFTYTCRNSVGNRPEGNFGTHVYEQNGNALGKGFEARISDFSLDRLGCAMDREHTITEVPVASQGLVRKATPLRARAKNDHGFSLVVVFVHPGIVSAFERVRDAHSRPTLIDPDPSTSCYARGNLDRCCRGNETAPTGRRGDGAMMGEGRGQAQGEIVAMGGGGFSMEPDNPLLDDFVLSRARQQPARVCFLPTASGDSTAYIAKFYRAFSGRCHPSDLTLFGSSVLPRRPARTQDLAEFVANQDVFYVGGGNTLNLLNVWRAHGLDLLLRQAWESGAILSGLSAGMICWFEASLSDSFGEVDSLDDGLGLVEGSGCPHYDSEGDRRSKYHQAIANGMAGGYGVDDGVALHFVGKDLVEVVSSRREARAYRVESRGGQVIEEPVPTRFLRP